MLENIHKRLMDAQALAVSMGAEVNVTLTDTGPSVHFFWEHTKSGVDLDEVITYQSEDWEMTFIEEQLDKARLWKDAFERRRELATTTWAALSDEQKIAIKESIFSLPTPHH